MNKKEKLESVKNKNYENIDEIFGDIEHVKEKLTFEDYMYCLIPSFASAILVFIVSFLIIPYILAFSFLIIFEDKIFSLFSIFFLIFYTGFIVKEKEKKQVSLEINSTLLKKAIEIHPLENVSDIHEYKKVFLSQTSSV